MILCAGFLAAPAAVVLGAPSNNCQNGKRENLCSLSAPPALCQPNASVTVEETALRAYQFYRAFVVDGDPKTMFSLIDSTYKVSSSKGEEREREREGSARQFSARQRVDEHQKDERESSLE